MGNTNEKEDFPMSTVIKHKEFTHHKVYKTEVAGRPLTIDVGKHVLDCLCPLHR